MMYCFSAGQINNAIVLMHTLGLLAFLGAYSNSTMLIRSFQLILTAHDNQ